MGCLRNVVIRIHVRPIGAALIGVLCALLLAACEPPAQASERNPERATTLPTLASYSEQSLPRADPRLSLAGRPDFDAADLTEEQRAWYERLRVALYASLDDMVARVGEDNSYDMGRWAFQFNHALLVGLRTTGDLAFLDAVDEVAQTMRAQLADAWCDGVDERVHVNVAYGTVEEGDGHLNFRLRRGDNVHYCRDTSDLDEALVHGHLALLMHAYHVNRGNPSPSGIDYGERADFWFDYLRNHFEAKWRERSGTAWPDMDFLDIKFCHTYHQMLLYYTFVGWRLQDDGSPDAAAYLHQATRLTDGMFEVPYREGEQPGGFIEVETPTGEAVVYSFGAPGNLDVSATHLEACPVTYARYMLTSVLNLYLEGFPRWDDGILERLATGIAHFVMDTESVSDRSEPFAAGVTGERQVASLPPTEYRERVTLGRFAITPFAALAPWDISGRIERISLEAYEAHEADPDEPEFVYIPAGVLLSVTLGERADGR